jgi:hypothetical protein
LHAINSFKLRNIFFAKVGKKVQWSKVLEELRFVIINNRRLIFLNVLMVYFFRSYFQLFTISVVANPATTGCRFHLG